jgi:hypothetical protein
VLGIRTQVLRKPEVILRKPLFPSLLNLSRVITRNLRIGVIYSAWTQ